MGNAKYKREHREQGLCLNCSRPALPGRVCCIVCNETDRVNFHKWLAKPGNYERKQEQNRKQRKLYRETNRCIHCGAPLGEQDEGRVCCMNCRDGTFTAIPNQPPISGELLENYYKKIAEQS